MPEMLQILRWAAGLCMAGGVFFSLVTALGMLRFPDAYTRLHAGTKGLTIGVGLVLLGSALSAPSLEHGIKTGLIGVFMLVTNPMAMHSLARVGYRRQRSRMRLVIDEYQEWKGT